MWLGGKPVRIDLAYPELKIAIEVDSWEYHGQVRSQFDCDHIRRDELVLLQVDAVHVHVRDVRRVHGDQHAVPCSSTRRAVIGDSTAA